MPYVTPLLRPQPCSWCGREALSKVITFPGAHQNEHALCPGCLEIFLRMTAARKEESTEQSEELE